MKEKNNPLEKPNKYKKIMMRTVPMGGSLKKYTLIKEDRYILKLVSRDTIVLYCTLKEINHKDETYEIWDEKGKEIKLTDFLFYPDKL